ncbi:hypothetical protein ACJMK2_024059 [Sinanodonta woodiana]|uniref:Integrin alpha second immunoglobulin-like domain-containing protein n=1 Tax=Sinanodonta woodiana TaxID=1069815 RepID=A0ABD3T669_SINWO
MADERLKMIYVYIFAYLLIDLRIIVMGFNVDTHNYELFYGPRGSYFGFSVAFLRNDNGHWLLAGAPRSHDQYQPEVDTPGALYKCPIGVINGTYCLQVMVDNTGNVQVGMYTDGRTQVFLHDKSNQWLGVSLDVSPRDQEILVCAHRWKDAKFVSELNATYSHGICYKLHSGLHERANIISPLVNARQLYHEDKGYPIWAFSSVGQSAQFSKRGDFKVLGAPGINNWHGGFVVQPSGQEQRFIVQPETNMEDNWLLGYSVAVGCLLRSNEEYVVVGAPRANMFGAVLVFKKDGFQTIASLFGDQFGGYFGAAICIVDVNDDHLDDIIVGSPFFSDTAAEQGRVDVFLNRGLFSFEKQTNWLGGDGLAFSRLGHAISSILDINGDGFNDLAVGAPTENENRGAIYIYNGCIHGVWPRFSQKLKAADIDVGLRSFGSSFSRPRKIENTDQIEFASGAYLSDSAVIVRTKSVMSIHAYVYHIPGTISRTNPHIDVFVCFTIHIQNVASWPHKIEVEYAMEIDENPTFPKRSAFMTGGIVTHRTLWASPYQSTCDNPLIVNNKYTDIWRDVVLRLTYRLRSNNKLCRSCPMLQQFDGYRPNNPLHTLSKKIQYDKDCGRDNLCSPNLVLSINQVHSNWTKETMTGQLMALEIKLKNKGENAYDIVLEIQEPNTATFVRMLKKEINNRDAKDRIQNPGCTEEAILDDQKKKLFKCLLRKPYPLPTYGEATFTLLTDPGDILYDDYMAVSIRARNSNGHKVFDSTNVPLLVNRDLNLRIEGISKPEQIFFDYNRGFTGQVSNIDHIYSMTNMGPNVLHEASVSVCLPKGAIFYSAFCRNQTAQVGHLNNDGIYESECITTHVNDTRNEGFGDSSRIGFSVNCNSSYEYEYMCHIGTLRVSDTCYVMLKFDIKDIMTNFKAKALRPLELVSQIAVTAPMANKRRAYEVKSIAFPLRRNGSHLLHWIIATAALCACVILALITLLLYKIGFFDRPSKPTLQRLESVPGSSRSSNISPTEISIGETTETSGIEEMDTDEEFSEAMSTARTSEITLSEETRSDSLFYLTPIT